MAEVKAVGAVRTRASFGFQLRSTVKSPQKSSVSAMLSSAARPEAATSVRWS